MPNPHDPYAPADPVTYEATAGTKTSESPPPPVVEQEPVPKGTSSEILAWVGDDKGRAQRALRAEEETNRPRKGLVEELEEIITK